jgi:Protein of unknown function (DUF3592)
MNARGIFATFLVWLVLTVVFAAIGLVGLDWPKWYGVAKRAVRTEGTVTGKEPENHQFIRYSYEVGGQAYSGLGSAEYGNPTFEQLNIGDQVNVFYDSDNPSESILGEPEAQATSITIVVLFVAIAFPLLAMIGLYQKGWLPVSKHRR